MRFPQLRKVLILLIGEGSALCLIECLLESTEAGSRLSQALLPATGPYLLDIIFPFKQRIQKQKVDMAK